MRLVKFWRGVLGWGGVWCGVFEVFGRVVYTAFDDQKP